LKGETVKKIGNAVRNTDFGRRSFLKGAAAGVMAAVAPASSAAQPAGGAGVTALQKAGETETPPEVEVLTTDRPGSDFMVDVIKSLDFEYICANPGSTFRSLHESLINYGGNKSPELITCCHEESSVAMGHGYAKVEGKPLAAMLHGPVGLQHASMAIYNAYCDRVPVVLLVGNTLDATKRRPGVEWVHSGQDLAAMVRDFIKWDDTPISLEHFAESFARGYKIAMTPPMMPVLLIADGDLQERPVASGAQHIAKLPVLSPPQGEDGALADAARMLVAAENPVIVADRAARTAAGMALVIELAEALQAPVIDQWGRLNFSTRHPLNHTERAASLISSADVILGLELTDFWGTVHSYRDQLERTSALLTSPGAKLISITAGDLYAKGNYQDLQRYPEVDLAIEADAEASLPALIEAVKRQLTADRRRTLADRGAKLAATRLQMLDYAREQAAYAWDASPISTARVSAELWAQIKDEDWALVSETSFFSNWPMRLWDFTKYYEYIGGQGGYGVGYGAPAAVGAALAHRKHGRIVVNIQNDGDLMYAPGVLWTAAHHRIPLLNVMHNNRAYHQEMMHIQRMANRHQRGITRAAIGTSLEDPNIDYAKIASGMGVYAEGPISNSADLGPAIKRALAVVKRGEPALLDVVTQPR
jgi:thiamine pyrophosphate-dependent acetolactate synthase large subunit-like protein